VRGESASPETEWFSPAGLATGVAGVIVAAVVAIVTLVESGPAWLVAAALLFGAIVYVSSLRPRAGLTSSELVLRQMFSTEVVPLSSIGTVRVGRMLEVTVGATRYRSAAVGRTLRRSIRPRERDPLKVPADYVEDRILAKRADATARADEPGPVTRTWAWPEIVVVAVLAVAFVITLFLA